MQVSQMIYNKDFEGVQTQILGRVWEREATGIDNKRVINILDLSKWFTEKFSGNSFAATYPG